MRKLHIEIRLDNLTSKNDKNESDLINNIKQIMPQFIFNPHTFVPTDEQNNKFGKKVLRIFIECSNKLRGTRIDLTAERLETAKYYFYTPNIYGEMAEEVTEKENNDGDGQIGTFQWELPTIEFEGFWENLIYEIDDCPKLKVF
uniref:Uncharacterized protein n=1 Tax=Meloidogyne hapla TaxID=6305 RepID=A0A1I8B589_MELHA